MLPLLPLLALAAPLAAASPMPEGGSHNRHNPYRQAHRRAITADASSVNQRSYDFVIAGGGCAGLALASRLSEWSNVTVLLIEAGGNGDDVRDQIDVPGYSYLHGLTVSPDYDWHYQTVSQADAGGVVKNWPRGKGLGGSGAVNGLYWNKGDEQEYDAWGQMNPGGDQTWNWQEMRRYMMKSETYHQPNASRLRQFGAVVSTGDHGFTGPIQTAWCQYIYPLVELWIPAWLNMGLEAKDLGAGDTHGVTITPSTINPTNQSRSDGMAGYINPLPPRSNLVILTNQQVTQILFNGSTDASGNIIASGVRFQSGAGATSYSVQANKEVIIAGGTVGSPQLLQLSGVGPSALLSRFGIQNRLDLPVGYNLQDHLTVSAYWNTPPGTLTWANLSNSDAAQAAALDEWRATGTGPYTYVNNAMGYPNMADIMNSSQSSANSYAAAVASQLDKQVADQTEWLVLPANVARGMRTQFEIMQQWLTGRIGQLEVLFHMLGNGPQTLGIQVALQHPWSRGTIFISSNDPFTQPAIDPHYFGMGYDIDIMQYGLDFGRRLARSDPLTPYFVTENRPGTAFTGERLQQYARETSGTEFHPLGTCSMLPRDQGGVVDTNLMVYGSANLRVIDASVMPLQVSAHLMASVYGVAEKGADIIKQRHWAVRSSSGGASNSSQTTAQPGSATDGAVTSRPSTSAGTAGAGSAAGSSPLSQAATIGIGVGAGVGGAIILAAIIAFFCFRKKKNAQAAGEKGWYEPAQTGDAHAQPPAGGRYREPGYAMNDMSPPLAAFATQRKMSESPSVASMNMEEMAGREPLRTNSAYGMGNELGYRDSTDAFGTGASTPNPGYGASAAGPGPGSQQTQLPPGAGTGPDTRAADFQPGTGDERYGQPSWTVRQQEQRYVPVNIR